MKTQGAVSKCPAGNRAWSGLLMSCAIALLAPCAARAVDARSGAGELLDAQTVLGQIKHSAPAHVPQVSEAAKLLADIQRFRTGGAALKPDEAVAEWLRLFDHASKLGSGAEFSDLAAFDADLRMAVGMQSVIAALPAPSAWPALREQAQKRAGRSTRDYHAIGLQLLAAVLLGDHAASDLDLKALDAATAALPPDARMGLHEMVTDIRSTLTKLYGDPAQIAHAFLDDVMRARGSLLAEAELGEDVEVPDLVTLVGEPEATKILTQALAQPVTLRVESGDATRLLAARIALQNVARLRAPQWALVDRLDAAPLYEALRERFASAATPQRPDDPPRPSGNYAKQKADTYYVLSLLVDGRVSEALKALESIAGGQPLSIPKPAIQALQQAHQNDTLYTFLGGVLRDHPEVRAWDVYIEQAAFTGHSREALATLDAVLKRAAIPSYVRADLQHRRADALLALDDLPGAQRALTDLLRAPPSTADQSAQQRANSALRLAGLGRVLGRPDLGVSGLQFVEDTLALPSEGAARALDRLTLLRSLFAEARRQHREAEAQRVAIAELKRRDTSANQAAQQMEMVGMPGAWPARRAALIELLSLYAAANRPTDARALLDQAEDWGARDLRDLLNDRDSQGVPFALSTARTLEAGGDRATAVRIATATIAQFPGYDAAYELESSLDPHALDVFDAQFRTDQFEERPLIWKAVILARNSQYAAAEQAIRAAIAIDPSDGDEGVNDRMRAYSVLADILEAKGDSRGAGDYRTIVAAIRISERSDELYALGLFQRAFAGYREALKHFSDAYCIQSRLAVQLSRQGQHEQAAEHYRKAYELMPASFGRVESHCFGCESVFDGAQPQSIATEVFARLVKRDPSNSRVHYLQGYLLEEQGRYADALPAFRKAVQIDGSYLNAWRHLHQLSEHIYLDAADRDVVTTKLIELDPQQRHVTYDIGTAGDFTALWSAIAQVNRVAREPASSRESLYPLKQSASVYDRKQAELPVELRQQVLQYQVLLSESRQQHEMPSPPLVLGKHRLLAAIGGLLGADAPSNEQPAE